MQSLLYPFQCLYITICCPKIFSSGLILLAELAEEYRRDLAAVPASWEPGTLPVATSLCEYVCIQHQMIKPFCSLENVSSCKKKKQRRRMLKTMEKRKSLFLQAEFCCYFVRQVLFVR
jgi:hypothetical protein